MKTRTTGSDRDPALQSLLERFNLEQARLEERLIAQAIVGDLKSLKQRARRERLTKLRGLSRSVVEELLVASRSASPLEGEEWASLALLVCHQLSPEVYSEAVRADLLAETYSELASSRRRGARWNSAREALRLGQEQANRGSRNPVIVGLLLAIEGAIEGDVGELEKAEAILMQARSNFEKAGEHRLVARTLVQLAYVLMDAEPARSLTILQEGNGKIPETDKRLLLLAESTRIDCLVTLGDGAEAMRRFEALSDLWDQIADPFFQLRRRFFAGRLLESVGRYSEADSLFEQVIALDLEQRSTKSLFLDLVYLFGSFVRRGDLEKAVDVCHRAVRDLSVLDIEEDSLKPMRALWIGLGQRAQQGKVGLDLVLRSRHFIRNQWRAGGDPLATKESAL